MSKPLSLHDTQLKARLGRLINGDQRAEDVTKLYIGKRSASYGRPSFRELADFMAHPDLRNRGPVADRIRDMRTTLKPMLDRHMTAAGPSIEQLYDRAESNFRMATDEQIAQLSAGRKRSSAESVLKSGLAKIRKGNVGAISQAEEAMLLNFGDRMIWNPALLGQEVFDDFKEVMTKNGLVEANDGSVLDTARTIVILHAIATMHGTEFDLGDGISGVLRAGHRNKYGCLEVTIELRMDGYPKQVLMQLGIFWTDLVGRDHVSELLIDRCGPWEFPIEIQNGKLQPIGELPAEVPESANTATIQIG